MFISISDTPEENIKTKLGVVKNEKRTIFSIVDNPKPFVLIPIIFPSVLYAIFTDAAVFCSLIASNQYAAGAASQLLAVELHYRRLKSRLSVNFVPGGSDATSGSHKN